MDVDTIFIAVVMAISIFIILFVGFEIFILICVLLFAVGFAFFMNTKSVNNKKALSTKTRVLEEAKRLGTYDNVTDRVVIDKLVDAVMSKYGLVLKNDYRKMALKDTYGRLDPRRKSLWEWHLFNVVDTCELSTSEDEIRKSLKKLVLLQTDSNICDIDAHFAYCFDTAMVDEIAKSESNSDGLDWLFYNDEYPAIFLYKDLINHNFLSVLDIENKTIFDPDMTGLEYEAYCAEILRKAGWGVVELPATGDHGADLLATLNDKTIAIQCKKYAKPLSNTSVQEVVAAIKHYRTDYGVVVTNSTYTKGAQTLAKSNEVLLLHHDDLIDLEKIIG